jgi:hypothetical protein
MPWERMSSIQRVDGGRCYAMALTCQWCRADLGSVRTSFDPLPIGEWPRDVFVLQALALICWVCGKQASAVMRLDLTCGPRTGRRRPRQTLGA